MRVLFVIRSWGVGGEQRAASLLTGAMARAGHEIELLILERGESRGGPSIDSRVRVKEGRNGTALRFGLRLLRHVREIHATVGVHHPDVLIGFGTTAAMLSAAAALGTSVPLVICERNDPASYPWSWTVGRHLLYRRAVGAVFQTPDAARYFPGSFFQDRVVIKNPVDPGAIPLEQGNSRRPVICNTSRLTAAKNHAMLIEAFSEVAEDHPEFALEIYGEGPLRGQLLAQAKALDLEQRVTIHEPVPDILEQEKRCSIFVLSSNNEGFPNSLAEAMALGLACVATDCPVGGPRSMIEDGISGLLVPVNDTRALARALSALMSDASLRTALGTQAAHVAHDLDATHVASRWIEFLTSVTAPRRATVLAGPE